MGCDIHAHIEIKVGEEWIYYAPALIDRNYPLFAKMANVHNSHGIEPISDPKGLASLRCLSRTTNLHLDRWAGDGHSHSYLNAHEIKELVTWAEQNIKLRVSESIFCDLFKVYLFGNSIEGWLDYPKSYPSVIEDIRLIFWFDN